jgi:hypothetical protein
LANFDLLTMFPGDNEISFFTVRNLVKHRDEADYVLAMLINVEYRARAGSAIVDFLAYLQDDVRARDPQHQCARALAGCEAARDESTGTALQPPFRDQREAAAPANHIYRSGRLHEPGRREEFRFAV